ncbi:MAG: hypothetical protein ACI31V_04600 [Bacilli bacterium]
MSKEEIFNNAIEEVVSELTTDEKNTVKEISRKIKNRYDTDGLNKKFMQGGMGKTQSFLDPVLNEESRTTKSVPRKGFTSISRIAKG